MNAAIFDSHKFAQRLIDAGVTPQAAGVHAEILLEVMRQITGGAVSGEQMEARLVARIDNVESRLGARIDNVEAGLSARIDNVEAGLGARIDNVETRLGARIDKVEARLDGKIDTAVADLLAKIAESKAEMVRWMVSLGLLQFALISALVLKLAH